MVGLRLTTQERRTFRPGLSEVPTVHRKTSIRAFPCTNKLKNFFHYKSAENVFEEPAIAIFARIKPIKNNVAFVNNQQKAYKLKLNFVFNDTLKAVSRTDFPQIFRHTRRNFHLEGGIKDGFPANFSQHKAELLQRK